MLLWLANMGFAGGTSSADNFTPDERRKFYAAGYTRSFFAPYQARIFYVEDDRTL